jgi:hypothetical protein
MTIPWREVIAVFGGQAVLLGAVAWLVKSLISEWLKRDTQDFKTKLELSSGMEIEKLKSSLQIVAVEHQVRFTKLHERRAEIIADLYERMVNVFWDSQQFVFGKGFAQQPEQGEEYSKAMERVREFTVFVDTHRIYLPAEVCAFLDKFVEQVRKAVINIGVYGGIRFPNSQSSTEFKTAVEAAIRSFQDDIPALRTALEGEFRGILGAETAPVETKK